MTDKTRIPVILSGARTPMGRFLGGLAPLQAPQLGAVTVAEAVKRSGIDPGQVEDVIMGTWCRRGRVRLRPGRLPSMAESPPPFRP